MFFGEKVTSFLFSLQLPFKLPKDVGVLDVYQQPNVQLACTRFYQQFYHNHHQRQLLLGINPGRFGGGVTGIPFTDPIRLANNCLIANEFTKQKELSSAFIYDMIAAFGGPETFYQQFYISSVSPLGFVKHGKNLNYYDDTILMKKIESFAADCIQTQISFGINTSICFCIGEGENLKFLTRLNEKYKWFGTIKGLPHPRFIMQYKVKQKEAYINQYLQTLATK
jgi:hypothetical protein